MFYAFAMLFFFTALVIGIPAFRHLQRMRRINRHAGSASGYVSSVSSALGWLWTAGFGSSTRPTVKYESPAGKEMAIEVADSSMFTFRKYEPGMRVEVVFDSTSPWDAYARPEWDSNRRDLWLAAAFLVLSVVMYVAGRIQAMQG